MSKFIETRRGKIFYPAYIPVTTFGKKYPLDDLIRPYLPRLSAAVMVSYHYAKQMEQDFPHLPLMIDSGGFAALFKNSKVVRSKGLGVIKIKKEKCVETIHPADVLEFQEQTADIAFTLDFPIPSGTDKKEAAKRLELTISNAV